MPPLSSIAVTVREMAAGKAAVEARRALEKELGAAPPAGIKALSADEMAHLAQTMRTAKRDQAETLDRALNDALKVLPRVLRGPVKKAVGG